MITVANDIASLPMLKIQSILNEVSFSALSRIQENRAEFVKLYLKGVRVLNVFAVPVFFGISAVAPEIVLVFLGEQWRGAIVPMQILSLVIPLRILSNMLAPALMGAGLARVSFTNTVVGVLLIPPAALVGVQWGVVGVAIAWAIAYPVVFLINAWRTLRALEIPGGAYYRALAGPLASGVLMLVCCYGVRHYSGLPSGSITILAVTAVTGAVVYVTTMVAVARTQARETLRVVWR